VPYSTIATVKTVKCRQNGPFLNNQDILHKQAGCSGLLKGNYWTILVLLHVLFFLLKKDIHVWILNRSESKRVAENNPREFILSYMRLEVKSSL